MNLPQLMIGVFFGVALIVLGLAPGLFRGLVDGVVEGLQSFRDSITQGISAPRRKIELVNEHDDAPVWLAILGAALIALTVVGFIIDYY